MLSFFEDIEKTFDVMFFIPHDEKEDTVRILTKNYKDPGEPIGGNQMGSEYHIMLFREGEEDNIDLFDGILCDPREYVSQLIPQDWYGIIARKTTTSKIFVEDTIAKFKEL
jgi:hypothetical protein